MQQWGVPQPQPCPMWDNVTSLGEAPRQGDTGSPGCELGGTMGFPGGGAELAPLQGTGGEISDGFSPRGIKAGVCTPTPPGHWGGRERWCGAGGAHPLQPSCHIPSGSQGSDPSPSKALMGQERLGGPL